MRSGRKRIDVTVISGDEFIINDILIKPGHTNAKLFYDH